MSEFGKRLSAAELPFTPQQVAWSPDGRRLAAFGFHKSTEPFKTQRLVLLNAVPGPEPAWATAWEEDALDLTFLAFGPDGESLIVVGRLGSVETITEFVEFLDCSDLPPSMREDCKRFNEEEAGLKVRGHKIPDRGVTLLKAADGTEVWTSEDKSAVLQEAVFSPDGLLLAAWGGKTLRLLDAADAEVLVERDAFTTGLRATVFSPDARTLVTADAERVVAFDVAAESERWTTALPEPVLRCAFLGADALLAVTDVRASVLDAAGGTLKASVDLADPLPGGPAELSPDHARLARAAGQEMALWDLVGGARRFETGTGESPVIRFNPRLPEVAVASFDGVQVLNTELGTTVWDPAAERLTALAYTADGLRLALGGPEAVGGFVRVHDMNPADVSHLVCETPALRIALTAGPDPLAVVVSQGNRATVFHAATGEVVLEKSLPGAVTAVAFGPDGRHFAIAGLDGGVRLFDALSGDRVWLTALTSAVNGFAFSPEGDLAVVAGKAATRLARDTGAAAWTAPHPQAVTLVAVSGDGKFVATACEDRFTRLLDAATGAELAKFRHDIKIRALAFDPLGARLAAGDDNGNVKIIDTAALQETDRALHTKPVIAVAFGPGGRLATSGKDKAVHVLSVGSGPPAPVRDLDLPHPVVQLAFHPTGPDLALVSDEPSPAVTVIDPVKGTALSTLAHPGTVNDLAYSPDGTLLATACADRIARVYPGKRS
ncbi:hypothetical protein GCM10022221_13530 [Actinocorallia aurea]